MYTIILEMNTDQGFNTNNYFNNSQKEDSGSWIDCAGKLASLMHILEESNALLIKIKDDNLPNPIYFLTISIKLISSLREKSNSYIEYATKILSKELISEEPFSLKNKIIDKLLDHDPGKRGLVESASQRDYLISLGPYQPKLSTFPINCDISKGKQRQFNPKWIREYPDLEYSTSKDAAFCFVCGLFPKGPNRLWANSSWSQYSIRNWAKMKSRGKGKLGKLEIHFSSNAHKSALIDY